MRPQDGVDLFSASLVRPVEHLGNHFCRPDHAGLGGGCYEHQRDPPPQHVGHRARHLVAHRDQQLRLAERGLGLDPGLKLTIADMVALQEALALVGLKGFDARLPAALSGGQRQRVALARALVRRRPLLLLDEPFSALDPGLRAEMLALVDRLRRDRGLTVVMVSHEVADARRIAERTAFVHDGRIMMEDETEQLLARRDCPELKRFLGLA